MDDELSGAGIGAGVGALLGLFGGMSANDQKKRQATRDAIAQRFSPWSQVKASTAMSGSVLPTALSGVLSGAKQGTDLVNDINKNAVPKSAAAVVAGGEATPTPSAGDLTLSYPRPQFNPYSLIGGQ